MSWLKRIVSMTLVVGLAWVAVAGTTSSRAADPVPPRTTATYGSYIVMPHPASTETRRKAQYLAREKGLPLIADSAVRTIEIREFK